MRCPNPTCRKEIPLDALDHPLCGWRSSSAPAPELELEPPPTPPERIQTRAEVRANIDRFRSMAAEVMKRPQVSALDRWRAVLANPKSTYTAKEMAKEAIKDMEAQERHDEAIRARRGRQDDAMRALEAHRNSLPPEKRLPMTQGSAFATFGRDALEAEFDAERAANASRETPGSRQKPYRSGSRRA